MTGSDGIYINCNKIFFFRYFFKDIFLVFPSVILSIRLQYNSRIHIEILLIRIRMKSIAYAVFILRIHFHLIEFVAGQAREL